MFKKILYPTDFSDVAERALEYIKQLKGADAQEVVLTHIIDTRGLDIVGRYASRDFLDLENIIEDNVRNELGKIEAGLLEKGFKVKVRIERGIPFREILRLEEEEHPSLIVIGSHGLSNIQEMLLGSVSEKVIRKAIQPVLVIKR